MTWRVIWSPQSQADLLAVGFEVAASVGRAVVHWTETAEGLTELLGGDLIRIVAPGAGHAIVELDETRGAFRVLRIRINDQFRICFRWTKDGPEDVEIVDYH